MSSRRVRSPRGRRQKNERKQNRTRHMQDTAPMLENRRSVSTSSRRMGETMPMQRVAVPTTVNRSAPRPKKVQTHSNARKKKLHAILDKIIVKGEYFDYDLLLDIIFLMCFGLIMLYSTSAYSAQNDFGNDMEYFTKQAAVAVGGFLWMFLVSKVDYHVYGAYSKEFYWIAMGIMALVQTPLGVTIYGARRWIQLPFNLTLQPSEIMKIGVILFISYELCRLEKKVATREVTIHIFIYGIIAFFGVYLLTDNLSTAIIVFLITCILYFIVHPKTAIFIKIVSGAAIIGVFLVVFLAKFARNSGSFRVGRILTWLDPENNAGEGGFQVLQGLYAIGSGGFFGKGLGNSTQKLGVIPEVQNDMILTVICEELGVFGVIVILLLFGLMLYRLMFIAKNAPDLYGSLLAIGIMAHIALQVTLNIAVVTNLIPTTGITLPFISYGGTSILFLMTEMGIALGVSRTIRLQGENK